MKYKDYIEKPEVKKILEPVDENINKLAVLSLINMLSGEIGGEFENRVSKFLDEEERILLNSEVEGKNNK